MTTTVLHSPLKRVGGKNASRFEIGLRLPHPKTYKVYCEPCFGAGHVFFSLPRSGHQEVISDKEDNLMTFWMQMQDHADEMRYYEACRGVGFPHEQLATLLNQVQGKVALSYYPHELLDVWYPAEKWHRVTWQQPKSSDIKSEEMATATEMLLTNYDDRDVQRQGSLWEVTA